MSIVVFLNHDFVDGMARRADLTPLMQEIAAAERRLKPEPLRVHPYLCQQDTGQGRLPAWANKHRSTDIAGFLLRLLSGPFVTDLSVNDQSSLPRLEPPLPPHPPWLEEAICHIGRHALDSQAVLPIALSFAPDTILGDNIYQAIRDNDRIEIRNAKNSQDIFAILSAHDTNELKDTISILEAASARAEHVRVLEKARYSAKRWTLDCKSMDLYSAIIALDDYARALDQGMSRELAAAYYQKKSSVEMSQESGLTKRLPLCFNARNIEVPDHGKQYFDMHAKPGAKTRIHIWTTKENGNTVVYIGHCGEHLPLPSGK